MIQTVALSLVPTWTSLAVAKVTTKVSICASARLSLRMVKSVQISEVSGGRTTSLVVAIKSAPSVDQHNWMRALHTMKYN